MNLLKPLTLCMLSCTLFIGGCGDMSAMTASEMEESVLKAMNEDQQINGRQPVQSVDLVDRGKNEFEGYVTTHEGNKHSVNVIYDPDNDKFIWTLKD